MQILFDWGFRLSQTFSNQTDIFNCAWLPLPPCITSMIGVVDRHACSQQLQDHSVQPAAHCSDQNHRPIRATPLCRLRTQPSHGEYIIQTHTQYIFHIYLHIIYSVVFTYSMSKQKETNQQTKHYNQALNKYKCFSKTERKNHVREKNKLNMKPKRLIGKEIWTASKDTTQINKSE